MARLSVAATAACLVLALALGAVVPGVSGAMCNGKPSPNAQPNMNPIDTGAPVFVRAVPNAQLWQAGSGDNVVPIVHLWGTPYEKGFAHGTLMRDRAATFIADVWAYLEDQVEQAINGSLPGPSPIAPATLQLIADIGLDAALDVTSDLTAPSTGAYFFEQMRGLSDAAGIDYDRLRRVHMLGELTRGRCSMFGAWGEALADQNALLTMRALDWDVDGPFKNFPELTVYHAAPNSTENTFMNIGWTGWLGSISGVSEQQMSIHEIGVSFPDDSFGAESASGIPFTYLLRDILQFDSTLLDGMSRLASANRTCHLILGLGGGKEKAFRGVQYGHEICRFIDDRNFVPVAEWHEPIDSMVYFGMDWLCPAFNSVLHDQLAKLRGQLTAQLAIQQVMSITQTGDLHVYVADLVNMKLWYSRAAVIDGVTQMGYNRPFIQLDLNAVFGTSPVPPSAAALVDARAGAATPLVASTDYADAPRGAADIFA